MAENGKTLSTAEFSQLTGISVSTITQMLRKGKIQGEKRSGKWVIYESEFQRRTTVTEKDRGELSNSTGPLIFTPGTDGKGYDVKTFAEMTYLTETGVRHWLKTGRLSGVADADGNILVGANNLQRPEIKHLIRK